MLGPLFWSSSTGFRGTGYKEAQKKKTSHLQEPPKSSPNGRTVYVGLFRVFGMSVRHRSGRSAGQGGRVKG